MQRQSLGSPSSKLHHGGIILLKDDTSSSTSPTNDALSGGGGLVVVEEEEEKVKKLKMKPAEIYIHFIPMLTLLCLLVLYLSSHKPSQIDLAEFAVYKHLSDSGDSSEDIQKFHQTVDIKQGAVSWKNRRSLRLKMADV
ncbi:uncharacterized protein [Primulina huaijiensis]|uniref:uncharacterized protein isoform X1 n=1 Tax=Primulina huaijiensis TaxID=1492673 RepID=UPI003CC7448F